MHKLKSQNKKYPIQRDTTRMFCDRPRLSDIPGEGSHRRRALKVPWDDSKRFMFYWSACYYRESAGNSSYLTTGATRLMTRGQRHAAPLRHAIRCALITQMSCLRSHNEAVRVFYDYIWMHNVRATVCWHQYDATGTDTDRRRYSYTPALHQVPQICSKISREQVKRLSYNNVKFF